MVILFFTERSFLHTDLCVFLGVLWLSHHFPFENYRSYQSVYWNYIQASISLLFYSQKITSWSFCFWHFKEIQVKIMFLQLPDSQFKKLLLYDFFFFRFLTSIHNVQLNPLLFRNKIPCTKRRLMNLFFLFLQPFYKRK